MVSYAYAQATPINATISVLIADEALRLWGQLMEVIGGSEDRHGELEAAIIVRLIAVGEESGEESTKGIGSIKNLSAVVRRELKQAWSAFSRAIPIKLTLSLCYRRDETKTRSKAVCCPRWD